LLEPPRRDARSTEADAASVLADISWAASLVSLTSVVVSYLLRPEKPVVADTVQVHVT
jgi:hypothetical protein